jgi:hypothetical protein
MKNDPKNSLLWIRNRLQTKFEDDQVIIHELDNIIHNYLFIKRVIPVNEVEKICKKYYADWDLGKSELSFGMSEDDKQQVKTFMISLIKDFMNI